MRSIPASAGQEPDAYLQVNGINQLGSLNALVPQLGSLNGQWIVIDHNLIDDIKDEASQGKSSASTKPLTWSTINSFLASTEAVNKKYVFTTDQANSVTKVLKSYGKETVDGYSTYHYLVGFNEANVQTYVTQLCSALQQSSLGSYLESELGQNIISTSCQSLEKSTTRINGNDTVNVWVNTKTRLPYKVRISDPTNASENYIDVGLSYTGGNSYPIFISGQDSDSSTTFSVVTTLNTQNNSGNLSFNIQSKGSSAITAKGSFTITPTNEKLSLTPPANAVPITTVLNNLGLGSLFSGVTGQTSTTQTSDVVPGLSV